MSIFGASQQTAQITTGNVRTTYDLVVTIGDPRGQYVNQGGLGLRNILGTIYYDQEGTYNVGGQGGGANIGSTPGASLGAPAVYKYVLYKSTTNPALVAGPAVVYYTDETRTVVSGAQADGFNNIAGTDAAGLLMVNTTDLSALTAAILNNSGLGSGVWICLAGIVKNAAVPASTAKGDQLFGGAAASSFLLQRVAANAATALATPTVAWSYGAVSGGLADVNVVLAGSL